MKIYSYMGFLIKELENNKRTGSFYYIYKGNEIFSRICLATPKAACNVINTHLRLKDEDIKEELILIEKKKQDLQTTKILVCKCGCGTEKEIPFKSKLKYINGHNVVSYKKNV